MNASMPRRGVSVCMYGGFSFPSSAALKMPPALRKLNKDVLMLLSVEANFMNVSSKFGGKLKQEVRLLLVWYLQVPHAVMSQSAA